jgi:hypothetical protein
MVRSGDLPVAHWYLGRGGRRGSAARRGPGAVASPGPKPTSRAHWATASAALAAAAVKSRTNTVTIEEASWEPGFKFPA